MGIKIASAPPFLIFGAAVLTFAGWIAYDSTATTELSPAGLTRSDPTATAPDGVPIEIRLGAVHPGFPRAHIEQQLAALQPLDVEPIDLSSGTPVIRSRYRVTLTRPVPHLTPRVPPHRFQPGQYLLTVQFDGSKHGHPLLHAELTPE